jgi:YD repeat-containing protein
MKIRCGMCRRRSCQYALNSYASINGGVTLTITPGSLVRINPGGYMNIYGTLNAQGTYTRPITFTSAISIPQPGDWSGLYANGAQLLLSYCNIAYAGYSGNPLLHIQGGQASVQNCRIHHSSSQGIRVSNAQPTLSGNSIFSNTAGLVNATPATRIDARYNYWGDISGPFHATLNPNGKGNSVSDGVVFYPWLEGSADTMADLVVSSVSAQSAGTIGQNATVTFSVQNLAQPTTAGVWEDSIYQSDDNTFHVTDRLMGRVTHTGNLTTFQSYTASLTAPLPVATLGNHWLIVVADSQHIQADFDRTNNVAPSGAPIVINVPLLTLGVTATGAIRDGQEIAYGIVTDDSSDVAISANFAGVDQGELYAGYFNMPDTAHYDAVPSSFYSASQSLILAAPPASTHYVLLRGSAGAGTGQPYSLVAQALGFELHTVTPARAGNAGNATLKLLGARFSPSTTVTLKQGATTRPASQVFWQDSTTLFTTLDLTGLGAGVYDLQIQDGLKNAVLPGAFTVFAGQPGRVEARISSTGVVRPNREYAVTVDYANVGDNDVVAPLFVITAENAVLRWANQNYYESDSIQAVGIDWQGPAGILPPGASGQLSFQAIPVVMGPHVWSYFNLQVVGDPAQPLDWNTVKTDMQPLMAPNDAWDAIWANFLTTIGSTVGDYQAVLARNATYLSQAGEYSADANRLLQFEVSQAGDFGAIQQRYSLGAFGRGVPDFTHISVVTDTAGDVLIRYGSLSREFKRQRDGTWVGLPGDYAQLTFGAGVYSLRESDGTLWKFNPDGSLNYIQEANNARLTANYSSGRLSSFSDSLGNSVSYSYNAQGRVSQITDEVGRLTQLTYGASGEHLISAGLAGGRETLTTTYGSGLSFTVQDGSGKQASYAFLDHGGLGRALDPFGTLSQLHYDDNFQVTEAIGPRNLRGRLSYDVRGNLTDIVDPLGRTLRMTYEPGFNQLSEARDANGGSRS